MSRTIALASVLLLLAGCTTRPYEKPELIPAESTFPGIVDGFGAANQFRKLDVFVVHGMCNHGVEWAKLTFAELARALGMVASADAQQVPLDGAAQLYRQVIEGEGRQAILSAFVWSPLSQDAKDDLCFDVTAPTQACPGDQATSRQKRASANGMLKNELLNECLADALVYAGNRGRAIRDAMKDALVTGLSAEHKPLKEYAAGDAPRAPDWPLYMISDSLGSKILLDSIREMQSASNQEGQFIEETVARMAAVYLRANQIPLLSLTDASATPSNPFEALGAPLRRAAEGKSNMRDAQEPLPIIAFTDPNDLLSFALHDAKYDTARLRFVDVLVTNAPTYFGKFQSPLDAHTHYKRNKCVIAAVVGGSSGLKQACL
jgi:hypothetical protein